jgi:hypothetical protein
MNAKKKLLLRAVQWLLLLPVLATATARASVPLRFSLQGVLRDAQGSLLTDMTVPVTIKFFNAQTGGNQLGGIYTGGAVPLKSGLFTVVVDAPNIVADLGAATSVWMEATVN